MVQIDTEGSKPAFIILTPTLFEGPVPAWWDEHGFPVTYESEREAQLEIATMMLEKLQQFIGGERDFEDATTCDDFIFAVNVFPDRSIALETGQIFGRRQP
jgi:hypothetical protein